MKLGVDGLTLCVDDFLLLVVVVVIEVGVEEEGDGGAVVNSHEALKNALKTIVTKITK